MTDTDPHPTRSERFRRSASHAYRIFLFRWKASSDGFMIAVAVALGVFGGFGAIAFRYGIDFVQSLAWPEAAGGGTIARVTLASPWLRVLVPTAGGLCVGLIVHFFAREARGHGVPEVMEAIAVRGGVIRMRVLLAKLVCSAVTIGTGGSAGREGPIIQIGSSIGSSVGQALRVSSARLKTFVACGAAAGMAATFNAPIAAALFSGEVILGNFGAAMFGPIVISSVVGTAIARSFWGNSATFDIPIPYTFESPYELIPYAILGVGATFIGLLFVTVLHRSETTFEAMRVPSWAKPAIGGLVIGVIAIGLPQVMGVGYDLMETALRGEAPGLLMLALLFLKMFATSVTLGSGGSGGVFAPSLLLGALTGGALGTLVNLVLPAHLAAEPGAYALVGMGAMIAATTHAPITAIVILFELTGEYEIILPLMIACTISTLLAMRIRKDSIYTVRLSARGRRVRFGREVNVLRSIEVRSVMRTDRLETVEQSTPFRNLIRLMVESPEAYFYVLDEVGRLAGVLSVHDLRRMLDDADHLGSVLVAADVAQQEVLTVRESDTLDRVMRLFGRESLDVLPVVADDDARRLLGTLHRRDVVAAYNREMFRRDAAGELAEEIGHVSTSRVVEVSDGFGLLEVEAPGEFVGWTLGGLGVRARHGVDVLLIRRPSPDPDAPTQGIMPTAETVVGRGDRLLLFGRTKHLAAFREL